MVVVSMSFISDLHVFFLSSAKCMCQTSDKIGQEEEEENISSEIFKPACEMY